MNAELGIIEAEGELYGLTMVRRVAAKIEAVWAALVEPAELSEWLGDVELEPREGGLIRIDFDGEDQVYGQVRCFEPPHVFEFTWSARTDDPDASIVRFELATDGGETVLTLRHSRQGKHDAGNTPAGWHAHLDVLDGLLVGAPRKWEDCYATARPRYEPLLKEALG